MNKKVEIIKLIINSDKTEDEKAELIDELYNHQQIYYYPWCNPVCQQPEITYTDITTGQS